MHYYEYVKEEPLHFHDGERVEVEWNLHHVPHT